MANSDVDILIVGGGLTGAALLLALEKTPYRIMLIDPTPFSLRVSQDFDARSLALSPATTRILEMLELWSLIEPHARGIKGIHISEQHAFGCANLKAEHGSALGHVVELQAISHALHQRLHVKPDHQLLTPARLVALDKNTGRATIAQQDKTFEIKAKLIVAADGTHSAAREFCEIPKTVKDYQQHAIVANIGLARPHHDIAYERFTAHGPLALLPMNEQRVAMVWANPPDKAKALMTYSDADFLRQLQHHFGYRLGRFISIGQRTTYPLQQVTMSKQTDGTVVFVGNAAHTLHPVAGQGFNLGLRDVAMLAQCITQKGLGADMLSYYATQRAADQASMIKFTDGLIQLYASNLPGIKLARSAGLVAFEQLPVLKSVLSRYARGFGGITPDLACQIPL